MDHDVAFLTSTAIRRGCVHNMGFACLFYDYQLFNISYGKKLKYPKRALVIIKHSELFQL